MTAIQIEGDQIVAGSCRSCGYDLTGLRVGQRCPECNAPTAVAGTKKRDRELPMTDASAGYLRVLALALRFMVLGALMCIVAALGGYLGLPVSLDALMGIGGLVVWVGAVWAVTRPRPQLNNVTGGASEWSTLRLVCRVTQLALPAAASAGTITRLSPDTFIGSTFSFFSSGLYLIAAAGWVPLGIYISFLADWGSDNTVSGHLRGASWMMTASVAFMLFIGTLGLVGLVPSDPVQLMIFFASIVLMAAAAWFVFQLWSFATSVAWTIRNKHLQEGRDIRRAERDEARAEAERQRIAAEVESYAAPPPLQATLLDLEDASADPLSDTNTNTDDQPDLDPYRLEDDEATT